VSTLAAALAVASVAQASRLDDALEAAEAGKQFIDLSAVPAYQYAVDEDKDTGNYSLDAIGTAQLIARDPAGLGDTTLVIWLNSADKIEGMNSGPELAGDAGLLWNTNGNPSDSASTTLLVLGFDQWLFNDKMSVGVGKYFPGQFFLLSPYTADNSNTFQSSLIADNPVAGFWESIGIGFNAAYYGDNFTVQGGFVDAQADNDGLDFSSFGAGNYSYILEYAYTPQRKDGVTSVSLLGYVVDEHDKLRTERGVATQFMHEFGEQSEFATFGRYTVKSGGTAQAASAQSSEPKVEHGGFAGFAWNRPFGRENQQLAAAAMYGEPGKFQDTQGFNDQFGVEAYWKLGLNSVVQLTPSLQLMRNDDDDLEAIVGLRLFMGFNRSWTGAFFGSSSSAD